MNPSKATPELLAGVRRRICRNLALEAMFEAQQDWEMVRWCIVKRLELRSTLINLLLEPML